MFMEKHWIGWDGCVWSYPEISDLHYVFLTTKNFWYNEFCFMVTEIRIINSQAQRVYISLPIKLTVMTDHRVIEDNSMWLTVSAVHHSRAWYAYLPVQLMSVTFQFLSASHRITKFRYLAGTPTRITRQNLHPGESSVMFCNVPDK